jgi:hypothetical protein
MRPSRRRTSDHLHGPVEQTALIYKEGPELPRQPWSEQPSASPEVFRLGRGEAPKNLSTEKCGASS